MEKFLNHALDSLPTVASSPLSLIAYLLAIIAWVVVASKVRRNGQLLSHLEKLPEKDRLKALELEMGMPRLRVGLAPEQWLRHKIHNYYFLAFFTLCALILLLATISIFGESIVANVQTDITLSSNSKSFSALENSTTLTYSYKRNSDTIRVDAQMPYLELYQKGGPISGFSSTIDLNFPEFSIKFLNNTDRTIYISEAIVHVIRSEINTDPMLVIGYKTTNELRILNRGWGPVIAPYVTFGIADAKVCNSLDPSTYSPSYNIQIDTFLDSTSVSLGSYIDMMELNENGFIKFFDEKPVCVYGEIQYDTERQQTRILKFKTVAVIKSFVSQMSGSRFDNSAAYGLKLEAGKSGYTKRIPLSHVINAGEVDHFLLTIGSDKSCRFELSFEFATVDGARIAGGDVEVELFVPRGIANNLKDLEEKEPITN